MDARTRKLKSDLPVSLLMGVAAIGLLGYLTGLRIIVWNPVLITGHTSSANPIRNIFFLLLSTLYLYAILGLVAGVFLFLATRLYGALRGKVYTGRTFFAPWLTICLAATTLVLAFFMLTRQDLRSGNFDNLLVIAYYASLLFLGSYFYRSARLKSDSISPSRRLFTLPKFFLVFGAYLIFTLVFTLIQAAQSPEKMATGDPGEIQAALASENNGSRVAIFGWDGAEWTVIDDLLSKGMMPNLRELLDQGVRAPFKSLDDLRSPLIWTSMATGKVPEKHGIKSFGTFQFAGMATNFVDYPDGLGLYRMITLFQQSADLPVTSSVRRCHAYWNFLSEAKRTVGIVGWWASWPAEKVNGFVLSDRFTYTLFNPRASALSLREGQSYPPNLLDQVSHHCRLPESITNEELNRFMSDVGANVYPEDWRTNQHVDWNPMYQFKLAYTSSESFRAAGLQLYREFKPEVFAIYFEGIDMISHFFWQYYHPEQFRSVAPSDVQRFDRTIPEFYDYMDEILGEFLKEIEPGTDIIIVSDHGFGPDADPHIPYRTGDHRPYGIFAASGPHFKQGVRIERASVLDLTPTLLYLCGLPVARDMDGKVIEEAIEPTFLAAHPPAFIKSYETGIRTSTILRSSADAQMKEQIKALGYTQ
jgi:predicted AlkP superfamily phosphohydrolase/phosphomutase